jgi:hypothetical protein
VRIRFENIRYVSCIMKFSFLCRTYRHLNELEAVYKLCDYTITCPQCRKRMVIGAALPSIDYCKCSYKTHYTEKGMLMFRCSISV